MGGGWYWKGVVGKEKGAEGMEGFKDIHPSGERGIERELRCLNGILKEKLHCIHHNELNSANSHGVGNMGTHWSWAGERVA